jgi:nucleoside-diphosphate-sugar epimerase/Rps23 Pro-64 3,4-dihydroxylase Tpa1-like proline 4-hydroxylase
MAKKALVIGCSGLVGIRLVEIALFKGYDVYGVDRVKSQHLPDSKGFKFYEKDLLENGVIENIFSFIQPDVVYNTFGIKGSPLKAKNNPVDFLYPSFKINTEIINQCAKNNIWLTFVSSVGVYAPAEKFVEDTVWKTLPSEADWFPSWSKRSGELLLEAYAVQYGYKNWGIIRPANIFGENDDYSGNGTVISSTIKKVATAKNNSTIEAWGDGSPIRDFVYAGDVAKAIIEIEERRINDIVNFGSGKEISIKSMIESVIKISKKKLDIQWDSSKPNGDLRRLMDTEKQKKYNLLPETDFEDAISRSYAFYKTYFNERKEFKIDTDKFFSDGYYIGKTEELIDDEVEFLDVIKNVRKDEVTKEDYLYRFDYRPLNINDQYEWKIPLYKIQERDNYVKENSLSTIQRWYESVPGSKKEEFNYFRKIVENIIPSIYPDLKDNINHNDNFTIYENGDFIEPHADGKNFGRYCVILMYLSGRDEYNEGGGELIVGQNSVDPVRENFVILDFTKNNIDHAVQAVKNNFRRITYIDFVYNQKMLNEREENKKKKPII